MHFKKRQQSIEPYLKENETIRWIGWEHQRLEVDGVTIVVIFVFIYVSILIRFFERITDSGQGVFFHALFAIASLLFFIWLNHLYVQWKKSVSLYVSDERIIRLSHYRGNKIEILELKDLEKVYKKDDGNIRVESKTGKSIVFKKLDLKPQLEAYEKITTTYVDLGFYEKIDKQLKSLADKYQLHYYPYYYYTGETIIKGLYKGNEIEIKINDILPFKDLVINITCANVEGNAFKIYREFLFTKLNKKLGAQDIEVGDEELDEQYLLQSNDPRFLKEMLDEKIVSLLKEVKPIMGFIEFDKLKKSQRAKTYKTKIKPDKNVLDADLFEKYAKTIAIEPKDIRQDRISKLQTKIFFIKKMEDEQMLNRIDQMTDLMIQLGNNLSAYNNNLKADKG